MSNPSTNIKPAVTQVVVGVLYNNQNQILIAKRPLHKAFGGLWEFPGGKIEPNESPGKALSRELLEELQINLQGNIALLKPFHEIIYAYQPTQNIHLKIFKITDFLGEPIGAEGQEIKWVQPKHLIHYDFPAANQEIVELLNQKL